MTKIIECYNCNSLLEIEKQDIVPLLNRNNILYYIMCPCCNKIVIVENKLTYNEKLNILLELKNKIRSKYEKRFV